MADAINNEYTTVYKVRITSIGRLSVFGYDVATPAVVSLTATQIAILKGLGYNIDTEVGNGVLPPITSTDEAITAEWKKMVMQKLVELTDKLYNLDLLGGIEIPEGRLLASGDIGTLIPNLDSLLKVPLDQLPDSVVNVVGEIIDLNDKVNSIVNLTENDSLFYDTIDDITNRLINVENAVGTFQVVDDWGNPSHTDAISAFRAGELRTLLTEHANSSGDNKIHHIHLNKPTLDRFAIISSMLRFDSDYVAVVAGPRPTLGNFLIGYDRVLNQFVFTNIDYNILKTKIEDMSIIDATISELDARVTFIEANGSGNGGDGSAALQNLTNRILAIEELNLPIQVMKLDDAVSAIAQINNKIGVIDDTLENNDEDINILKTRVSATELFGDDIVGLDGRVANLEVLVGAEIGSDIPDFTALNNTVNTHTSEIGDLDSRLTAAEGKETYLEQNIGSNSLVIQGHATRLNGIDTSINTINGQVGTLQTSSGTTFDSIQELTERVEVLETGESNADEANSIRNRLNVVEGRLTNVETKVTNLESGSGSGSGSGDPTLTGRVNSLETLTGSHTTAITNLTTAKDDILTTLTQLPTLSSKVSSLESTDANHAYQITQLDSRMTAVEITGGGNGSGDLTTLINRITSAEGSIIVTSNGLSNTNERVTLLENQVDTLNDKASEFDDKFNTNTDTINSIQSSVQSYDSAISTLNSRMDTVGSTVDNAVSNINSTASSLGTRVTSVETSIGSLGTIISSSVDSTNEHFTALETTISETHASFNEEISDLKSNVSLITETLENVSGEGVTSLISRVDEIESNTNKNITDIESVQEVVEDHTNELIDVNNSLNEVYGYVNDIRKDYNTIIADIVSIDSTTKTIVLKKLVNSLPYMIKVKDNGDNLLNDIPGLLLNLVSTDIVSNEEQYTYKYFIEFNGGKSENDVVTLSFIETKENVKDSVILQSEEGFELDKYLHVFNSVPFNNRFVGIEYGLIGNSATASAYDLVLWSVNTNTAIRTITFTPTTTKQFTNSSNFTGIFEDGVFPILKLHTAGSLDGAGLYINIYYSNK
jgi:predicted  nucleic acid-binding Zn-ribbon protein